MPDYIIPYFSEDFAAVIKEAGLSLTVFESNSTIGDTIYFSPVPLKPEVIEKIKSIPDYEGFCEVK